MYNCVTPCRRTKKRNRRSSYKNGPSASEKADPLKVRPKARQSRWTSSRRRPCWKGVLSARLSKAKARSSKPNGCNGFAEPPKRIYRLDLHRRGRPRPQGAIVSTRSGAQTGNGRDLLIGLFEGEGEERPGGRLSHHGRSSFFFLAVRVEVFLSRAASSPRRTRLLREKKTSKPLCAAQGKRASYHENDYGAAFLSWLIHDRPRSAESRGPATWGGRVRRGPNRGFLLVWENVVLGPLLLRKPLLRIGFFAGRTVSCADIAGQFRNAMANLQTRWLVERAIPGIGQVTDDRDALIGRHVRPVRRGRSGEDSHRMITSHGRAIPTGTYCAG